MKVLNIIFGILLLGTVYYATYLGNLQTILAEKTNPEFNYLTFEMAPDREFSKSLFASIHENGMAAKLDLAKVYIEIGDQDNAQVILHEVLKHGDAQQQIEAQEFLDNL